MDKQGEIILYQPDETIRLEVKLEDETVWLTQAQMVELFQASKQNVSLHINNIFKEGELQKIATVKEYLTVQKEGNRFVKRKIEYYNLDVIISVGYRIKSIRGTQFRQWANKVLKDYLLKGYAINRRVEQLEKTVARHEEKINFFVRTSLTPIEGIFYNGQIFDAYAFVTRLIKSAKKSIVLIDNYVDESVLLMLAKRNTKAQARIYTAKITPELQLDLERHNAQYPPIKLKIYKQAHDRFLVIDDNEIYHIGASLKDLGKKLFAFSRLYMDARDLMQKIDPQGNSTENNHE